MVETQFGNKVKQIRADNGKEFQSNYILDFYKERWIVLQTSCPYMSQQKGVVEQKHRKILEVTWSLRFQASLPIDFWGECILTTTYLIKKILSKAIKNRTPHEILLGRTPNYENLKVFGCLVYAQDNSKKGNKFSERGRSCIFVGYPNGKKWYRVYDLRKKASPHLKI